MHCQSKHRIYLTCFFTLLTLAAFSTIDSVGGGSNYYHIESNYPIQSLYDHTSIMYDEDHEWTIERILTEDIDAVFSAVEDTVINGRHTVWLKASVRSDVAITDWWLMSRREDGLGRFLTRHDHMDVFFVNQGQLTHHALSGTLVPAKQKEVPELLTVNRVSANFERDSETDIYVRIEDSEVIHTRLELRDPAMGLPDPNGLSVYMGIRALKNFALIINCYVFAFFFFTRDRSYLYLSGMLLVLVLHYFLLLPYVPLISWLCPDRPDLFMPLFGVLTSVSSIFFFQFGRKFTELKRISPLWDKVMLYYVWALITILLIRLTLWSLFPSWEGDLRFHLGLVTFIGGMSIIIRLAFFKDILINYFVAGAGWLIFFSILGILWEIGILPFFKTINPWMIAQGGFMLIYGIALARKIQISERARSEVTRVKEVDSIKSKFFANISHEFRTPLTLILGPINQSLESIPLSENIEDDTEVPVMGKYLKVMKRSALRLQQLVNQILDLSKLDQGKLKLQVAEGEIIKLIRSLVFSFESLAERKHIHYNTSFPAKIESSFYDTDKLEKIIVNLLSNAFKFTPDHGTISVNVEIKDSKLRINISDSGPGIEATETDKIFDRFFQVEGTEDKGTGIGLALVKELVELHKGNIVVDSTIGQGTTFKVTLPYHKSDFPPESIVTAAQDPSSLADPAGTTDHYDSRQTEGVAMNSADGRDAPLILVVEDNPDLRSYIADSIIEKYQVVTASDGEEGEVTAIAKTPDLIISDVMMPKKNGFELCASLKNDQRTSHIPIVLLTAKADRDHKIEGLEHGADDYLTKPFDITELNVRISNLMTQRQRIREHYSEELHLRPSHIKATSIDGRFIRDVMTQIEEHMDNEYFTVEELAQKVGFSRSQLARKLKAITGKTSNQLIREFRLIRAKELLEQKSASVSEIAYQVGYSNLSYFSKSYKEMFGKLPSETI